MKIKFKSWTIVQKVLWHSSQKTSEYTTSFALKEDHSHIKESLNKYMELMQREVGLLSCGAYDSMSFVLLDQNGQVIKKCEMKNIVQ